MIKVVAVVVTYNRKELLMECLEALKKQVFPIWKTIIVDNCSSDGTQEWLDTIRSDSYKIILSPDNIGGAGGFNRGIDEAYKMDCDYVLVLDDDCILDDKYVNTLINAQKYFDGKSSKDCISALCGTVYENGKIAVNHRGYLVRHRHCHFADYWKEYEESQYIQKYIRCDIASFCGLMFPKSAIEEVGYPKKEYFIKYDDTDYSLRLRNIGTIVNVNSATMNHKIKISDSKNVFDWKSYYEIRNCIDMAKNNRMYLCVIKTIIRTFILSVVNLSNNKKSIKICYNAVTDGLKGKLGKNEIRYK